MFMLIENLKKVPFYCIKHLKLNPVFVVVVIATGVNSLYLSPWVPIQAQVTSPIIITHPLGHIPAKVEVQVNVQEGGSEYIFPASGSAQRDDDSDNVYGGVVYIYNENHVKIFVPVQENTSNKGLAIYTGIVSKHLILVS